MAANRFRGEATASVDGKQYTLRFDFNAMVAFEDATGAGAMAIFEGFEKGENVSAKHLRAIVWAMLQRHHPETTLELAGDLLSEDVDVIRRVMLNASPAATDGDAGNGKSRATPRLA